MWPALRVNGRDRLEGCDALFLGLADADQDPGGERDLQLAGQADRLQPLRRMLGRRPGVDHQIGRSIDSSIRPCDAVTSRSRARSSRESTPRFVCGQHPPLQCPLAGPDDVGGEVLVSPLAQALRDLRVDLRALAGEDQQLLGVAPHRLVEAALDLVRRVDVGLVRGEGAVLAVALAGPREGERVVAGEGDPAHGSQR